MHRYVRFEYRSGDIAHRIKNLAKQRDIPLKELFGETGLTVNTLANMKASMPKADNLALIADFLDCSVDYLLGRSPTPEGSNAGLSPALQRLIDAADGLTDEEIGKSIEYMSFLRSCRK